MVPLLHRCADRCPPRGPRIAWEQPGGDTGRYRTEHTCRSRGFTLLELLVVISIIALATAGVGLAMRDSGETQLQREGERLAALLESARVQSRTSGMAARWRADAQGFRFEGLSAANLPTQWLDPATGVRGPAVLLLGPEPLIGPQQVVIVSQSHPQRAVRVATDGLRPFAAEGLQ